MLVTIGPYPSVEDIHGGAYLHKESSLGKFFRHCWAAAKGTSTAQAAAPWPLLPNERMAHNAFLRKSDFKKAGHPPSQWPPFAATLLDPAFAPRFDAAAATIKAASPTCILTMGAIPLWLTIEESNVKGHRGAIQWSPRFQCKVLPTYDPATVFADWSLRSAFINDISKALTESTFKEIRLTERITSVVDHPHEIMQALAGFPFNDPAAILGVDVETEAKQITCMAMARSPERTVVVPFWNKTRPGWHHFTPAEEVEAWMVVKEILESPARKLFHNAVYDCSYMHVHGIHPRGIIEDSMLAAHALQPELPKSLGHLGSIYASETSWKNLNRKRKKDNWKANE